LALFETVGWIYLILLLFSFICHSFGYDMSADRLPKLFFYFGGFHRLPDLVEVDGFDHHGPGHEILRTPFPWVREQDYQLAKIPKALRPAGYLEKQRRKSDQVSGPLHPTHTQVGLLIGLAQAIDHQAEGHHDKYQRNQVPHGGLPPCDRRPVQPDNADPYHQFAGGSAVPFGQVDVVPKAEEEHGDHRVIVHMNARPIQIAHQPG